ncbi:hypothetical protein GNP73_08455 [Aliivibrio fischeri]|uniref:hypothetical protein n=1 Tax=Aliivibrio fischeri TaxID=668 RepID=UPI0012DAB041|nr:hypothetical protein [Aliivibrio fischeri]MUJ28005.1 hypothetical protein [Aliivibrio fischeri]
MADATGNNQYQISDTQYSDEEVKVIALVSSVLGNLLNGAILNVGIHIKKLSISLYFASSLSPSLCALVVSNANKRPRDTFWSSAPHIPPKHDKLEIRTLQWQQMVDKVLNYSCLSKCR